MLMPMWGSLSDRIGRKKVLRIGFAAYAILVIPMMMVMNLHNTVLTLIALFVVVLPMPIVQSVGYPTYAEQFPTRVRYTGMAFSFNFGTILGGGLTPYIVTSIIGQTHNLLSPAFLLVAASIIGFVTLVGVRETADKALS
jgi:MFS transporter, MHS family, proline/betaine transporter